MLTRTVLNLERRCFRLFTAPLLQPHSQVLRSLSSSVACRELPNQRSSVSLTEETDMNMHNLKHEGLFFTIPQDEIKRVLPAGLHRNLYDQFQTFQECCLMVRRPALEILNYMRHADYSRPANRYVLYGTRGSGRSTALAHAILHATRSNWMVLHVQWPYTWSMKCEEVVSSSYKAERINQPVEAAAWLTHFSTQNAHLLQRSDLVTRHSYQWSKRETLEAGAPLADIIAHGLSRLPHATDCVGALLREARCLAEAGVCRVLLAVDGVNSMWGDTAIRMEDRAMLPIDRLALVHNFRKLLSGTWTNGAMVLSVDENASPKYARERSQPRYLLQQQGFDDLTPMLPILCENYSDLEVHSCIEYYMERKWILNPEASTDKGRKELVFLSNKNPYELYKICGTY